MRFWFVYFLDFNISEFEIDEFLEPLSKKYCCFQEEYDKFKKFTNVVTGIKDRQEKKKKLQEENKKNSKKRK